MFILGVYIKKFFSKEIFDDPLIIKEFDRTGKK